ncbi:hypothetical protein GCM10027456_19860 [Kineosporia babensis]
MAGVERSTGADPITPAGGNRSYPKRSELRRAEARRNASRPADSRPSGAPSRSQRPPSPATATRSAESHRRPSFQPHQGVAVAPTPAALPTPQTDPRRPAGIDLPVPHRVSADPFRNPARSAPMVPIAVPAPRPLLGKGVTGAARLAVMALVVGAQGIGASYLASHALPLFGDGSASAAFVLTEEETPEQKAEREEAEAQAQAEIEAAAIAAQEAAERNAAVKKATPAKADAAMAQYTQAKAAADRIEAEKKARENALRNAQRDPRSAAKVMLADRGWSSSEFSCLDSLWTKESQWNYKATNPSSGAYGIPQSYPGSKMASAGADWQTNPVTQIRWGLDYIADRYGSPCGAWSFSQAHNSY